MMNNKKYIKADLNVHEYGRGRNKKFIMYTDFKEEGEYKSPRWHTRVYPDIEGNKQKAVTQAVKWLNGDVPEPYVVRNSPEKITMVYNGFGCPRTFFETDERGELLL